MSDLTPAFNLLLKKHEAPAAKAGFNLEQVDEFLKEAYRIVRTPPDPSPTAPLPIQLAN
jgi:hypothetical protein